MSSECSTHTSFESTTLARKREKKKESTEIAWASRKNLKVKTDSLNKVRQTNIKNPYESPQVFVKELWGKTKLHVSSLKEAVEKSPAADRAGLGGQGQRQPLGFRDS